MLGILQKLDDQSLSQKKINTWRWMREDYQLKSWLWDEGAGKDWPFLQKEEANKKKERKKEDGNVDEFCP